MKFHIDPPFFEIGPKAYLYGQDALALAVAAQEASRTYGVKCIFTPQLTDIHLIAQNTRGLILCAQTMDPIPVGRGQGKILPEAVKAAGADCVMLNHAECPLPLGDIRACILRAREVGLYSIVCADSIAEAGAVTLLGPDIVVAEPSELIGTGTASDEEYVRVSTEAVKKVNPEVYVLQAAGISTPEDVYRVIRAGADATGSSSAVCKAADPARMLREMLQAARQAYDERTAR